MGYRLRREVRDKLPPNLLTARERLLVLEIADDANDDTREGWPGVEVLAVRADMPVDKVGATLNAIGRKWAELRVPLGKGRDGRPYYSRPKLRTTYRIPSGDALDALLDKATQNGGPSVDKATRNRGPKGAQSGGPEPTQSGGPKAPQNGGPFSSVFPSVFPSSLSSQPEPANTDPSPTAEPEPNPEREQIDQYLKTKNDYTHRRILAEHAGITDTHTADTYAYAADHLLPGEPKGGGWWSSLVAAGDLTANLRRIDQIAADHANAPPAAPAPEIRADAHEFQPAGEGNPGCATCGFPRPNNRHRTT